MNRPHRLAAALLLSCTLLAACGSSQPSSTATGAATSASGGKTRDVEFSDCMRSHGVTNFPDPTSNGLQIPANIDTRSPAFRAAQQDCKQYLPNGGAPPATPAADRAAALALSRCMRSHGVPQFPDPAFTPPANAPRVLAMRGMVFAIPTSIEPKSPAFQQAAKDCGFGAR